MHELYNLAIVFWPFIATSLIFFFGRNFFLAWIKRRAEFGFDKKIEQLRGEISSTETRLRSALETKQRELDSLREATFSRSTSRAVALEGRKLQAAEAIWNTVVELMKLRGAAEIAGSFKLDKIAERVNTEPNLRQMMDIMAGSLSIEKLPGTEEAKHRPFVTDSVWASYSAYATVLRIGAVRLKMAQMGIADGGQMLKVDVTNKVIYTALPHREAYVKQHGPEVYHLLIEELEELVFSDIRNMLEGKDADAASVQRNAEIIKAVNEAQAKAQSAISEANSP